MTKHLATVSHGKGERLSVEEINTPEPVSNEVLIEVKALAFNPVDYYQRDMGFPPVPSYPAVLGSDVAGIVAKSGPDTKRFPPGTRVTAFSSSFYNGRIERGGFQKYTICPSELVAAIPNDVSFEEGAALPMAVRTSLTAYTTIDIPLSTKYTPADKQAILIWGASSSVGTFAVQTAKSLGFTVYATASPKHHVYIRQLGADHVFDYKDENVASSIIKQAQNDDVKLQNAHVVVSGGLEPTLEVLKATKDDSIPAGVAHSPVLPEGHPTLPNTIIRFNMSVMEPEERAKHDAACFHEWLEPRMKAGSVVVSPPVDVIGNGLEQVNKGLDLMKEGVSCKKLVISV